MSHTLLSRNARAGGRRPWFALGLALGLSPIGATRIDGDEARDQPKGRASNVVYVERDLYRAPGNSILGLRQNDDGSLTPLPGSPYPTGGLGISPTFDLGPFDSDQNVIVNPEPTLG